MSIPKNVLVIFTLGVLYYLCNQQPQVRENFAGNFSPTKWKVNRVYATPKGEFMDVPGNYQASLSPRFANVDFGANIRYNMPSLKNMGVNPASPLNYANMIGTNNCAGCGSAPAKLKEGFCNSCNVGGCRKGGSGAPLEAGSVPQSAASQQFQNLEYTQATDMLPVQDMSTSVNALGETIEQPIVYDRFIYANQRSRLYALGDPIRGDLPIVPCSNEWFRPSVHPQIDLHSGALAVIGGVNNQTSNELLALQNAAAGGMLDTGSGINYSVQKSSFLSGGGGDVKVSAFP
jgi:hypothetical protein